MNKFGLQDLTAAIVEKHGLEQEKAEMMVKVFFETIENGLDGDKSVKIKGLGTFKVVEVEPRESVNVNTGERVIIEGHDKINFVPEAALKDLVNKPFAQFETVVLNDGTDFSEIKNTTDDLLENLNDDPFLITENTETGSETDSVVGSTEEPEAETAIEESDSLTEVSQEVDESKEEDVLTVETDTEDQEEPIHILSESSEERAVVPDVIVENHHSKENTVTEDQIPQENIIDKSEVSTEEQVSPLKENSLLEKAIEEENANDDSEDDSGDDKRSSTINDTIIIIIIALVCYVGGYMTSAFFPLDKLLSLSSQLQVEKPVTQKKVSAPVVKKSVAVTKPAVNNAGSQSKVKENPASIPPKEMSKETSQPKNTSGNFDSEKYDNANRQVKYGAYRIVGIAKAVKLKSGQTLNYIAKRDFGSEDMLCYILALNEMNADAQVKEGQTILIPKLELRHKKKK